MAAIKHGLIGADFNLERRTRMSETSTLISCTGKITRTDLAKLPTPPATATHIPIPHAAVVETLVETLSHRQIGVVAEEFAVSNDNMEMFGVLDLEAGFEGCRFHADCPIMPTNWGCNCWVVRGVHLESA
jgi:hypothetical protein